MDAQISIFTQLNSFGASRYLNIDNYCSERKKKKEKKAKYKYLLDLYVYQIILGYLNIFLILVYTETKKTLFLMDDLAFFF